MNTLSTVKIKPNSSNHNLSKSFTHCYWYTDTKPSSRNQCTPFGNKVILYVNLASKRNDHHHHHHHQQQQRRLNEPKRQSWMRRKEFLAAVKQNQHTREIISARKTSHKKLFMFFIHSRCDLFQTVVTEAGKTRPCVLHTLCKALKREKLWPWIPQQRKTEIPSSAVSQSQQQNNTALVRL